MSDALNGAIDKMSFHNPRRFSAPHGVAIGVVTSMAAFASLCFDFGNGDFSAGMVSSLNYVVVFGFGLMILAAMAAGLALLAGRWIGTTLATVMALCLLSGSVIHAYWESQPLPRFRNVVWDDAPASLTVHNYESFRSFNDGTAYLFSITCTPDMIRQLCGSINLMKNQAGLRESPRLRQGSDHRFPPETEFYKADNIELAYTPSTQEALIACRR